MPIATISGLEDIIDAPTRRQLPRDSKKRHTWRTYIEQEMAQLAGGKQTFLTTPTPNSGTKFQILLKAENEKSTERNWKRWYNIAETDGSALPPLRRLKAGRMGEGGKQFVYGWSKTYLCIRGKCMTELIDQAHKRLADSDERIAELEEQVHRMVTLLKENNVAMTKLMKSCQEAARQAQEWNRLKPCPNFKEMENQIVVLRNADEEIAKSEERNRMQMEDFTEEMESQKKNFDELLQSMETVYRHAAERKK